MVRAMVRRPTGKNREEPFVSLMMGDAEAEKAVRIATVESAHTRSVRLAYQQ